MRSWLASSLNAVMGAAARGAGCALECSGRGDCLNGTCLCEIRYAGEQCAGPNLPYHACIGGMFLLVAFVCAVQLCVCVVSEYRRLKAPSVLRACKVTTQKMLYAVAFLASLIRGAYFVSPTAFQEGWATSLLSAYYPLLMSGSSLIVCFWAEVFHLRDIRWERPRFLSKSFLAFVTFNLIIYTLLAAEVLTTNVAGTSAEKRSFYQHVFNGCYAVLLFIVVIFFLIYGVEVFFKLRGEFLKETKVCTIISPRAGTSADDDDATDTLVTKQGVCTDLSGSRGLSVDASQLQQSRLGLVSQALMLILIAGFLASETLSDTWKTRVPVVSRNWHDIVFRLAEIGVALWFPCVLWNCMAPERLWLLNPRRLLARQLDDAKLNDLLTSQASGKLAELPPFEFDLMAWYMGELIRYCKMRLWSTVLPFIIERKRIEGATAKTKRDLEVEEDSAIDSSASLDKDGSMFEELDVGKLDAKLTKSSLNVETDSLVGSIRDCWICYDGARAEPLIRPCRCTGDVSSVHHDCLRRWLVESAATADGLKCKVCNSPYIVQETNRLDWERGFTAVHWMRTALAVACMCGAAAAAWVVIQLYTAPVPRVCAAGAALLVCYVCVSVLAVACMCGAADAAWVVIQLYTAPVPRVCAAGAALLVCYVCVRFLGTNTVTAYQRAKVSSLKILTEPETNLEAGDHVSTISKTVTVEIASKAVLERALKGDVK